jgi:hypothetical protein
MIIIPKEAEYCSQKSWKRFPRICCLLLLSFGHRHLNLFVSGYSKSSIYLDNIIAKSAPQIRRPFLENHGLLLLRRKVDNSQVI